ncbi:protein of unknown function [Tenacibaculum sp. 190524A02b]
MWFRRSWVRDPSFTQNQSPLYKGLFCVFYFPVSFVFIGAVPTNVPIFKIKQNEKKQDQLKLSNSCKSSIPVVTPKNWKTGGKELLEKEWKIQYYFRNPRCIN